MVANVVAKLLEILDKQVYAQGHIISGHTLKHLVAAVSPFLVYWMIRKRRVLAQRPVSGLSLYS